MMVRLLDLELAWGFAHPPDPSRHADRQLQARAARSRNALTCLCVRADAIAEGCGRRTRDNTGSLRAAAELGELGLHARELFASGRQAGRANTDWLRTLFFTDRVRIQKNVGSKTPDVRSQQGPAAFECTGLA